MKTSKNVKAKPVVKKSKKTGKTRTNKPAAENIADVKKLVQLLKINQIELEHQNEELRITQQELEASRNRYVHLFDFAPVPYFSLDRTGVIKEVNFIACKLLGYDRSRLTGKNINSFVRQSEKEIFNRFIKTIFENSVKQSCELTMFGKDKRTYHVRLEGLEITDALEIERKCQIALIDLTGYENENK